MAGFIVRTVVTAVAPVGRGGLVPGLNAADGTALVLAAIVLGIVNAFLRPVALFLSIPITILTFGLFILVVNAAMLGLAARLVPDFTVSGFLPALFGALVVSIVSWAINGALSNR
jgi:putative membrane protein